MRPAAGVFLLGMSLLAAPEAAAQEPLRPPLWTDVDTGDIPEPSEREISELFGILYNSWLRHLDVATMHTHRVALNVNAWDEVPDSSWFTNRIGLNGITVDALRAGVAGQPPEPGVWEVQELKTEGYTVGFQIVDAASRRYVLKFDRPESPERNSAAEKIGSLIMHAAGYNVPHYSIVNFRGSDLVVGEDAMFEDEAGRERPMEPADLEAALASLTVGPDGRYRGNASLFLTGVPKGPFSYSGTRQDDPNDIIPHELRREIRGFRVLASWFNHVDVKEANTFDAYVTEGDRRYVRHNFIDFGSTMGSGDFVNGPCRVGYAYIYDGASFAKSLVTLGVWERPWDASCDIPYPEVGRFEGEFFDAASWKPNYPNLAFRAMDEADGYWGAKVVTAFTDELVRVLAEEGAYTRPEVTRFVEDAFRMRRDKIGQYWFDEVTPLEAFELEPGAASWTLSFRDLGVERGYADASAREYTVEVRGGRRLSTLETTTSADVGRIQIEPKEDATAASPDRWGRTLVLAVDIQTARRDAQLARPVRVFIGRQDQDPELRVLGWIHAPRD